MAKTGYGKTWEVPHMPAKDWMCWNAVLRLTLPVMAAVLVMILALQGLSAGTQGVEDMLKGPLLMVLTGLLAMFLPILWLVFLLQGEDVLACTVDNQGVHVRVMLPCATRLKLLMRLKSPALLKNADAEGTVCVATSDLKWKDVRRVQLWPEKLLILFYAPAQWMRLALPCSAFTWEETLAFISEKIGKKKTVKLPEELKPAKAVKSAPKKARTQQVTMLDNWNEPEEWPAQQDVPPLEEVLDEVREDPL